MSPCDGRVTVSCGHASPIDDVSLWDLSRDLSLNILEFEQYRISGNTGVFLLN